MPSLVIVRGVPNCPAAVDSNEGAALSDTGNEFQNSTFERVVDVAASRVPSVQTPHGQSSSGCCTTISAGCAVRVGKLFQISRRLL